MHKLIPHKDLINLKQRKDLLNALQMEKYFAIKPTKTQTGGFLGTLLGSIEATKKLTGKGAPRIGQKNKYD